ncbi:MAG: DUF3526 domain-containing protein [Bryobacterales bacterium]|nr:DUF3526 domain-containing protein [Bryobacterales bacterium]
MTARIARKELLEMVRDGRFRAAGAIVFALLGGALLLGWQHHREVKAQHDAARKATRDQWLHQGRKNPHSAAHYGVYAFKPKSPLALVDHGTDAYTGVAAWLEAHKQNEFKYRPAQDSTAAQRFGELTGATVLQLLVPLLIVLLSFDALAGERESGTLRQLMSLGVRPGVLAAGKAVGVASALLLLLIPTAILGSVALMLASGQEDMVGAIPRALGMALSYLCYFGALIGLSLAVSALARSSRWALLVLLGFWMANGLAGPRVASDLAKAINPSPSAFAFNHKIESAIRNGIDGNDPAPVRQKRLEEEVLKKYNVGTLEALPVNFTGIRLQEGENYANIVFDRAYGELWDVFARQDSVHRFLGIVTPGLAVRALSMGFAGADFPHHAHFAKAAEEYRRMIQRVMNDDLARNAGNTAPYLAGEDLWKKVPAFHYEMPGAGWVVARQWEAGAMLLWWLAGAAAAAWLAVRRMRVN